MGLGDYLKTCAARDWSPGDWDCCVFLADWCIELGYPDPMAFIRGTYSGDEAATALIKRGRLPALAQRGFASIDLKRVKVAEPGDVAIIRLPTDDGINMTGAIKTDLRWASLTARGLILNAEADPIRVWRTHG